MPNTFAKPFLISSFAYERRQIMKTENVLKCQELSEYGWRTQVDQNGPVQVKMIQFGLANLIQNEVILTSIMWSSSPLGSILVQHTFQRCSSHSLSGGFNGRCSVELTSCFNLPIPPRAMILPETPSFCECRIALCSEGF